MDTLTPPRRFEELLDQALFVWSFGHYSERGYEAAARVLMGASEWSTAAEDAIVRTLVAAEGDWYGWSGAYRLFYEHLMRNGRDTPLTRTLIRSHHFHSYGEDGMQTLSVFRSLQKYGLWTRSSWEMVRRSAWWHYAVARYAGKDFRGYALDEIVAWSIDADAFPSETELKAAYWVWESKLHFYVPEGATLSDYSTEWDTENVLASWPLPKQKRSQDTRYYEDEIRWEKLQDLEFEEILWKRHSHPLHFSDGGWDCQAKLAARNPEQRKSLLESFAENRSMRGILKTYFDLTDTRFQPERTEDYRRLLKDPEPQYPDYPASSRNRAQQLVLWWPDHPETKPFLTGQVIGCDPNAKYEQSSFAVECLVWLVMRWPEDAEICLLVRESLDHPFRELAETAAELLRFCHCDESDYLPLLQERLHRGVVFFREYLMAASPDLEAMRHALKTLASLKDGDRGLSECGASILVHTYGPRKDLLAGLQEIARDSPCLFLQKDIAEILRRWLPLSFGAGLTCMVPEERLKAIAELTFCPENDILVRNIMAHDESLSVRRGAAAWLCSVKPGMMPLAELLPMVKEDDTGGNQLLHHWAGLHPQGADDLLDFGSSTLFTAPCPRLTMLISKHYPLVDVGIAYLRSRMAGDATDEERNAIFGGFVAEASQHQEAKEQLTSLASWLEEPWMSHSSTSVYIESILPLIEPDNQLPWLLSLADKLPREGRAAPLCRIITVIAVLPGDEGYQQVTSQAVAIVEWLTKQLQADRNSAIYLTAYNPLLILMGSMQNSRSMHIAYSRALDALNLRFK